MIDKNKIMNEKSRKMYRGTILKHKLNGIYEYFAEYRRYRKRVNYHNMINAMKQNGTYEYYVEKRRAKYRDYYNRTKQI